MSKVPISRTVSSSRERGHTPNASLPNYAAHLARKTSTPRQRERKALAVGEARRNDTVALVRSLITPARKRGGARFGPAPKQPPHERMQAPMPMDPVRRIDVYARDRAPGRRGLTDRQEERQACRFASREARAVNLIVPGSKGRPTPKRKASR